MATKDDLVGWLDEALRAHGGRGTIAELCRETTHSVYAPVGSVSASGIYRDGRELARISENIVVQVPDVGEG